MNIIENAVVDLFRGRALLIDFFIGVCTAGDIFGAVLFPIRVAPHEVAAGSVITIGFHAQLFLA